MTTKSSFNRLSRRERQREDWKEENIENLHCLGWVASHTELVAEVLSNSSVLQRKAPYNDDNVNNNYNS